MKTLKNFILMKSSLMKLAFIFLSLALFSACEPEPFPDPLLQEKNGFYSHYSYELPLYLYGLSHFEVHGDEEHRVNSFGDLRVLIVHATLTHKKDQDYILETGELMPLPDGSRMLYRKIRFDVKINPDGVVKFFWPDEWWESGKWQVNVIRQLFDHTGCIINGPCIDKGTLNFEGNFDGTNFYAKAEFMGNQVNPKPEMDLYQNLDGPVKFEISFTLEVQ